MVAFVNPFKRRRYTLRDVPASVRLMARVHMTDYNGEEQPVTPCVFAAFWYEDTQELTPEECRAVVFTCRTSTDVEKTGPVYHGSHVMCLTGEKLTPLVYDTLCDLVNGGNNPDGLVLDSDDLHRMDTWFNKKPGTGYSVALLGKTDKFYTGGRLCSLIVKNTGRVVYACPVDIVQELDLAPLCDEAFSEGVKR